MSSAGVAKSGAEQEGALQDLLDGLGVQLDAGHGSFERRRPEIEQARRARADDEDAAFDLVLADLAVRAPCRPADSAAWRCG